MSKHKNKSLALCSDSLYSIDKKNTLQRRTIRTLLRFKKGKFYEVLEESKRNELILRDELGQRHHVTKKGRSGWFQFFTVKRRVLIEKIKS